MAQLVIPSGSYNPLSSAWNLDVSIPTSGAYYLLKPYGSPPREASLSYQELQGSFPGVNGTWTKRFGGRMRFIFADLMIIGATEAAVETLKNSIMTACSVQARYSVTVPGGTARTGCKLVQPTGATPLDWENYLGFHGLLLQLVFQDLSGV
jgi:hypothetical protein